MSYVVSVGAIIPPPEAPGYYKVGWSSNERSTTFDTWNIDQGRFFRGRLRWRFRKFTITDDTNLLLLQKLSQLHGRQQTPLLLARIEQSRAGRAQVGIVVAGMADQFPCSLGQARERLAQQGTIAVTFPRILSGTFSRTLAGTCSRTIERSGFDHSHHTVG